jgi:hypothetical protein
VSQFRNIHALPIHSTEDMPTSASDKIRAMFAAPSEGQSQPDIAVSQQVVTEPLNPSGSETHQSSLTTAYIDKYVPIPFLHGDQRI